jgi:hypothetical protein
MSSVTDSEKRQILVADDDPAILRLVSRAMGGRRIRSCRLIKTSQQRSSTW